MANERLFDLTIRVAQLSDSAKLAELMCELGYETTKSEMQMRLEWITTDERYRTFVAERDGKVCGMIGTLTSPSYEHNGLGGRILTPCDIKCHAPSRDWSRAGRNCRKGFYPKRNQTDRFEHTACPTRCPKLLQVTGLRAKRMAICEATFRARSVGLQRGRLTILAITAVGATALP